MRDVVHSRFDFMYAMDLLTRISSLSSGAFADYKPFLTEMDINIWLAWLSNLVAMQASNVGYWWCME